MQVFPWRAKLIPIRLLRCISLSTWHLFAFVFSELDTKLREVEGRLYSVFVSDQPLLAIAVTCGIISTFKSYPTLGDSSLWLGLLGCHPEIWSGECYDCLVHDHKDGYPDEKPFFPLTDLRHPLLSVSLQLYSTILLPILHSLWLESGTGNANFFYAATLVHGLGCGMAIVDMLGAGLRHGVASKVVEMGLLDEPSNHHTRSGDGEGLRSARGILEDHDLVVVQYAGLGS